jgi:PAS domain S-box-containing protein
MSDDSRSSAPSTTEARYRAIFETTGPGLWLLRGTECIECNRAAPSLFGLPRKEALLGQNPFDLAPALQPSGVASAELAQRSISIALEQGAHSFEWQALRNATEPVSLEIRLASCGTQRDALLLCIAIEMTERGQIEQALHASEQRFRTIVERATEGLAVVDAETRQVRYVNPALCGMLGWSLQEMQQMRVDDLHPPPARELVLRGFARQATGELTEASFPILRKDGSTVDVSVRGVMLDLDGRRCVVGLFTDLTERRLMEAERLRAQKVEALGALAGGVAHDFNNVLQGIFGYISAAKAARSLEQARELLQSSEQALHMAVRLTNQLLTFSRGGAPLKAGIELGPAVERAAKLALSGTGVALELDLAEELAPVLADEGQIEQVIHNIVLNAAQATAPGGRVAVRAQDAALQELPVHLPPGRYVSIAVVDQGAGIRPEDMPHLFDPYFTTKPRGSGLGLATAYSMVRRHGGALEVQSAHGAGSTFTIWLPAHDQATRPSAPPPPHAAPRTGRVLVMDDDRVVRGVMAELLGALGHAVELAEDGAAAVTRYRTAREAGHPFDAVIVDLTVAGGMGGLDTLARLRAIDPDAWVIAASGYSDDAVMAEHERHGFNAALRKPFTLESLERVLAARLRSP